MQGVAVAGEDVVAPQERVEALVAAFRREYARAPEGIAMAPGRVNLIGEHVDYNDGLVLPFAIDRSVMCAWARSHDGRTAFHSMDHGKHIEFARGDAGMVQHYAWFDYPSAVLSAFTEAPFSVTGLSILVFGNVPEGTGLSSSAAIEVAVAGAFRDAFALAIDDVELARLCQRAENEYVGVQSGIMDQFAATLSRAGHALLVDCRTLAYEHVPLRLESAGLAIVIANSGVKRELVTSAYNERRHECEQAVVKLRALLGRPELTSLRDVSVSELDSVVGATPGVPLRRARHVVGEIARVAACVEALGRDDFGEAGRLMVQSHRSLRDDYEVSSEQLDLLVALATAQEYVLGARLTGAGFGGCTVNLVRTDAVERFERDVIAPYRERAGLAAEMYATSPQGGLRTWRVGRRGSSQRRNARADNN